jgi:dolichyl-phosphate-mannose--protein O-mannosyl transferase
MIFEAFDTERNQKRITHTEDYHACGYDSLSKQVYIMSFPELNENNEWLNGKLKANTFTDGNIKWAGFGSDSFFELYEEIKRRELVISPSLKTYIEETVLPNYQE